jgi:hypothetical protein
MEMAFFAREALFFLNPPQSGQAQALGTHGGATGWHVYAGARGCQGCRAATVPGKPGVSAQIGAGCGWP